MKEDKHVHLTLAAASEGETIPKEGDSVVGRETRLLSIYHLPAGPRMNTSLEMVEAPDTWFVTVVDDQGRQLFGLALNRNPFEELA